MYVPAPMVAAVIFVLVFLVLGLGVVFLAFSGRRSPADRRGAPARAGRRFVAVVVTIVVVGLGVAVPLAIGVVNKNDHAKSAPGGVDLNAAQDAGPGGVRASTARPATRSRRPTPWARSGPTSTCCTRRRGSSSTRSPRAARAARARCPPGWSTAQDAQDVAAYVAAVAGRG